MDAPGLQVVPLSPCSDRAERSPLDAPLPIPALPRALRVGVISLKYSDEIQASRRALPPPAAPVRQLKLPPSAVENGERKLKFTNKCLKKTIDRRGRCRRHGCTPKYYHRLRRARRSHHRHIFGCISSREAKRGLSNEVKNPASHTTTVR